MLVADAKEMRLTYKKAAANRADIPDPKGNLLKALAPQLLNLFAGVVATVQDVGSYDTKPYDSTAEGEKKNTPNDVIAAKWETGAAAFAGIASGAATWYQANRIAKTIEADDAKNLGAIKDHKSPNAEISLNEEGVGITADDRKQLVLLVKDYGITMESTDKKVEITAKTDIDLEAKSGNVSVTSKTTKFRKCAIQHAYLSVSRG
jgi:hypothetical protein